MPDVTAVAPSGPLLGMSRPPEYSCRAGAGTHVQVREIWACGEDGLKSFVGAATVGKV